MKKQCALILFMTEFNNDAIKEQKSVTLDQER